MRYAALSLGLGASLANAVAIRNSGCRFQMVSEGTTGGPVGEISSGQVRFGVAQTTFQLEGTRIFDDKGHGCWWTRTYSYNILTMSSYS